MKCPCSVEESRIRNSAVHHLDGAAGSAHNNHLYGVYSSHPHPHPHQSGHSHPPNIGASGPPPSRPSTAGGNTPYHMNISPTPNYNISPFAVHHAAAANFDPDIVSYRWFERVDGCPSHRCNQSICRVSFCLFCFDSSGCLMSKQSLKQSLLFFWGLIWFPFGSLWLFWIRKLFVCETNTWEYSRRTMPCSMLALSINFCFLSFLSFFFLLFVICLCYVTAASATGLRKWWPPRLPPPPPPPTWLSRPPRQLWPPPRLSTSQPSRYHPLL